MILNHANHRDIEYVIHHLRDADQVERNASTTPQEQVHSADILAQSSVGHTLYHNDRPVAVYGIVSNGLGVGSAWMWTTDQFKGDMLIKQSVRDVKKIISDFIGHGNHRVQVLTMESHENSASFLELVGFIKEAVLTAFGADKQDFVMYSIVRAE